ncbi:class I glutamine amidotransferase-like protein [Lactifluus subvellereus]|nr:class I glutamine amidotransferase-like protein [Lactifluus subvellereus]
MYCILRVFVFTSTSKTLRLQGGPTGWYLPEAAYPYYVLSPHFPVDFAAPAGPNPPLGSSSIEFAKGDNKGQHFLNDPTVKALFENAKLLSAVHLDDYVAIFYVGGHGPAIDLPTDEANIQLANKVHQSISGESLHLTPPLVLPLWHWLLPSALIGVTGVNGKSIFDGKIATGFPNAEKENVGKVKVGRPFCQGAPHQALGGTYEKATEPWGVKVVRSGNLITGQNPTSARPLAEEILETLLARA